MKCYLCGSDSFNSRKGEVRDNKLLGIYECKVCCLVSLSSIDHIEPDFYEKSGMHGECLVPMHTWLSETEWDDNRRFEMLKPRLPNNRVLDFGCGAGGFLAKAKHLASDVPALNWSQHLHLFNPDNLRRLAELAGLKVISIQQVQRYPLSNHLYWLSRGVPGGHKRWAFLDKAELSAAYEAALASIGQCDTLIANLERSS